MVALERGQVRGAREALRLVVEADLGRRARQALDQGPQRGGDGADARRERVGDVGVVAAEQLVAALAGERDLHRAGRELRDQVRGERRRVGERLVERLGEPRQQVDRVRAHDQLVMVGAVQLGHAARQLELVERALLEADRERAHAVGALARGQRGERRRVDAARQHHADRDIGDEVGATESRRRSRSSSASSASLSARSWPAATGRGRA